MLTPGEKAGVRKFLQWIEDTQKKNSWDLSELLQLQQDWLAEDSEEETD